MFGPARDRNALLIPQNHGDTLKIHDYIRDSDTTTSEVPRSMRRAAATHACADAVWGITATAYQANQFAIGIDLMTPLADDDHPDAQYNLGVLRHARGDIAEAETWYRRAADAGHPAAQSNLGFLLQERGQVGDGESGRSN